MRAAPLLSSAGDCAVRDIQFFGERIGSIDDPFADIVESVEGMFAQVGLSVELTEYGFRKPPVRQRTMVVIEQGKDCDQVAVEENQPGCHFF